MCYPNCNEVKYSVAFQQEAVEWEKICSFEHNISNSALTPFEAEVLKHIQNSANEAIAKYQDALMPSQDRNYHYCRDKLKYDIAIVDIVMDSPTALKYVQDVKVHFTDIVANFGKLFDT